MKYVRTFEIESFVETKDEQMAEYELQMMQMQRSILEQQIQMMQTQLQWLDEQIEALQSGLE